VRAHLLQEVDVLVDLGHVGELAVAGVCAAQG